MRVLLKHRGGDALPYLVGGIFEVVEEDEYYYYFNGFCWPKKFAETVEFERLASRKKKIEQLELLLSNLPIGKLTTNLMWSGFGGATVRDEVLDLSREGMVRLRELIEKDLRKQLQEHKDELSGF